MSTGRREPETAVTGNHPMIARVLTPGHHRGRLRIRILALALRPDRRSLPTAKVSAPWMEPIPAYSRRIPWTR